MMSSFRNIFEWLGRHGGVLLGAALIVVVGSWGFVELLDEVREGDTQQVDDRILVWTQHFRGDHYQWLEQVGRDVTALGGITVLTLVTLAVAIFLICDRKFAAMWTMLGAVVGGWLVSAALKYFAARPRPPVDGWLMTVTSSSFPSSHAMMSAVVYLTLGVMLARVVPGRAMAAYFLSTAMFLTFIVGISRIYMGVHYPTDVLEGWAAGLVWATVWWFIARWLQRRGTIENRDAA